jgi:hypothetical protein
VSNTAQKPRNFVKDPTFYLIDSSFWVAELDCTYTSELIRRGTESVQRQREQ